MRAWSEGSGGESRLTVCGSRGTKWRTSVEKLNGSRGSRERAADLCGECNCLRLVSGVGSGSQGGDGGAGSDNLGERCRDAGIEARITGISCGDGIRADGNPIGGVGYGVGIAQNSRWDRYRDGAAGESGEGDST